jgi:Uma2 family endonuclease
MDKIVPGHAKVPFMSVVLQKPWTQEAFFDWAEAQDIGYEFDGFEPVAMNGGFNTASAIGVNLIMALGNRLRGTGCRPLGPNAGVETINKAVRYPDALVTCSKLDPRERKVAGVVAIFEVVGRTADANRRDRITKVREYAGVASIRRYVIIESSTAGLTVMERGGGNDPWTTTVLTIDDTLIMPEIGIEIPVAEIYEDITFIDEAEVAV